MLRIWIALCLTILSATPAFPQDVPRLRDSIASASDNIIRTQYLIRLGKFYQTRPGEHRRDLDSSLYFLDQATKLAIQMNDIPWFNRSQYEKALTLVEYRRLPAAARLLRWMNGTEQAIAGYFIASAFLNKNGQYRYDLDSALIIGKMALRKAIALKMENYTAHLYETVAAAYMELNEIGQVTALMKEAPPTIRTRLLISIGDGYRKRPMELKQDLDTARMFGRMALEMATSLNDSVLISKSAFLLGFVEMEAGTPAGWAPYLPLMRGQDLAFGSVWLAQDLLGSGASVDTCERLARQAESLWKSAGALAEIIPTRKAIAAVKNTEMAVKGLAPALQFERYIDTANRYGADGGTFDRIGSKAGEACVWRAIAIAGQLNDDNLRVKAWLRMAHIHCIHTHAGRAWPWFHKVLDAYQRRNQLSAIARIWAHMGYLPARARVNLAAKASAFNMARYYYTKIGDSSNALTAGIDELQCLIDDSRISRAAALIDTLTVRHPATSTANAYKLNQLHGLIAQQNGDHSTALRYTISGMREAEMRKDTQQIRIIGTRLARIHADLGEFERSIDWYKRSLDLHRQPGHYFNYTAAFELADLLITHRGPKEALDFIETARRVHPANDGYSSKLAAGILARCYHALGRDAEAEEYYQESISNLYPGHLTDKVAALMQYNISLYYFEKGNFNRAAEHLATAANFPPAATGISIARNMELLMFRCDSATGNYTRAISHYQAYKAYSDSLFNFAKARQVSELQIQYETEKKDQSLLLQAQEIRISEQNIMLLTRQGLLQQSELNQANLLEQQSQLEAERKDQDILLKKNHISLLTQNAQIQQGKLEQETIMRNVAFGGAGLLLVIMGLLINGYRLKQQHNHSLKGKQVEIGQKNASLEKLLHEKEWLLKEIHHRVKNNLQIVMSLLNSQGAYLQNDAALMAIRDSQHRVQAISLIHKKLYQSDNVGLIFMPHYIHELIAYLSDCFDTGRKVRFSQDIAAIHLDVSQAVPLALILNEAVTNAIKYAFPDREGSIRITLQPAGEGYALSIADNGKGLPADFDVRESRSLGMSLMEGLSSDLGGRFNIGGSRGTEIRVSFLVEKFPVPALHLQPHVTISTHSEHNYQRGDLQP